MDEFGSKIISVIVGAVIIFVLQALGVHKLVANIFGGVLGTVAEDNLKNTSKTGEDFNNKSQNKGMVHITGGCFQMIDSENDVTWKSIISNEAKNTTCVQDFHMSKYEVTVGNFRKFIEESGYITNAEKKGECGVYSDAHDFWEGTQAWKSWKLTSFKLTNNHPVVCVSLNDAIAYTKWLSKKTNKNYRIPTVAEWRYVLDTQEIDFIKDNPSKACQYANVSNISYYSKCDDPYQNASPIGKFESTGFGLYDMLGNVWEWTCINEKRCVKSSIQGGSWQYSPHTDNSSLFSHSVKSTFAANDVGFRVAY